MCGIAGALVYDPDQARMEGLVAAVTASVARGWDSFGVVRWSPGDGFRRVDSPGDRPGAWLDAVGLPGPGEATMYLHTSRAEPTTEWCRIPRAEDIPPFISGDVAVAHNGIVSNDHELEARYALDRTSPIDSAVLPPLVQHLGTWRALSVLQGGAAFAILDARSQSLVLARNFMPLTLTWEPGIVCFASEARFFPFATSPFKPYQSFELPPYSGIELSARGYRSLVAWGAVPAVDGRPWLPYPALRRPDASEHRARVSRTA